MTRQRDRRSATATDEASLISGHVVLDLINTVAWRLDAHRRVDRLPTFGSLADWSLRAGLIDSAIKDSLDLVADREPQQASAALAEARKLREQLYAVLVKVASPERSPDDKVTALHRHLVTAVSHATFEAGLPLRWRVQVERPADLAWLLGVAALDLLQSPAVIHVRQCEGRGCGWLFIDHSRNHTRRWCSASDCGNRERVRRHYQAHRQR